MTIVENHKIPILGLRIKSVLSSSSSSSDSSSSYEEDTSDLISVMVTQDHIYKCRDYIGRRRRKRNDSRLIGITAVTAAAGTEHDHPIALDESVDEVCREKMCEWSYRVCDHFDTSREIVAFAFSFLDRFIDRCSCDRTAFKLAAMTSLYIATKMLNTKQLSIMSLAELSRGEFDVAHIAEMERIILETLEWRVNPPTVQSYITSLRPLLPRVDIEIIDAICHRAMFFAELSVYDYIFVTEDRYLIAIACCLNAIEGLDNVRRIHQMKKEFQLMLSRSIFYGMDSIAVEKAQARLWYLYSCSAQMQYDDIVPLSWHTHSSSHISGSADDDVELKSNAVSSYSPVSVNMKG